LCWSSRFGHGNRIGLGYLLMTLAILRGLGLHHVITPLYFTSEVLFMELQYCLVIDDLPSGSFKVVRSHVPLKSDLMDIAGHDLRP